MLQWCFLCTTELLVCSAAVQCQGQAFAITRHLAELFSAMQNGHTVTWHCTDVHRCFEWRGRLSSLIPPYHIAQAVAIPTWKPVICSSFHSLKAQNTVLQCRIWRYILQSAAGCVLWVPSPAGGQSGTHSSMGNFLVMPLLIILSQEFTCVFINRYMLCRDTQTHAFKKSL